MAKIPVQFFDPTLEEVDACIEAGQDRRARPYLGMSGVGDSCERKVWYRFRWAKAPSFDASTLKKFACGHAGEDVQAERLRLVRGITLHTHDPTTGGQFAQSDFAGHFRGHMDGAIVGLLHDPQTWHVWEHKQSGEKAQQRLRRLIEAKPIVALREWNQTYHAQAQLYMHYTGMRKHYLTCATPGGRETISVITDYDPGSALEMIDRAHRVIFSDHALDRVSDRPDWYECKWCEFSDMCHKTDVDLPDVTCRSCAFSTPNKKGEWTCELTGHGLSPLAQAKACDRHLYSPALMPWEPVEADPDKRWIRYDNDVVQLAGDESFREIWGKK